MIVYAAFTRFVLSSEPNFILSVKQDFIQLQIKCGKYTISYVISMVVFPAPDSAP